MELSYRLIYKSCEVTVDAVQKKKTNTDDFICVYEKKDFACIIFGKQGEMGGISALLLVGVKMYVPMCVFTSYLLLPHLCSSYLVCASTSMLLLKECGCKCVSVCAYSLLIMQSHVGGVCISASQRQVD